MSRIHSTRNLCDTPGSASSSIPAKISFNCRDDETDRRPSTSEADSSSDLNAEDDLPDNDLVDTGDVDASESASQIGDEDSENDAYQRPTATNRVVNDSHLHASPEHSSWTDMDFSVIVSLISPVGSWLFGHDHLKNFFVVLFLIFYLHQLIEVPWKLYHSSRPRRPAPNIPVSKTADNHHVLLARSELRTHELLYLMFTLICPFLGAILLRKVVATVTGEDVMPWFSTNLFILATGVRPWSHLVSRLRERDRDLHDIVHYPSPEIQLVAEGHFQAVLKRMESLERELKNVKRVMADDNTVSQAHQEIFGALEDVERTIKRQERRAESTRTSVEARMAEMEDTLLRLESEREIRTGQTEPGALVRQLAAEVLELPHAIWKSIALGHFRNPKMTRRERGVNGTDRPSSSNYVAANQAKRNPRLETIPEYDGENNIAFVPANNGPRTTKKRRSGRQPGTQSQERYFSPSRFLMQVISSPYRLCLRITIALIPPVQKIFS